MSARFRNALLAFVGVWLFACAFEAVVGLHWPNPLAWERWARGLTFFEATVIAWAAFVLTKGRAA